MEAVQRRLIRPRKLIQVEPFNVVILWSNGEIRLNDFAKKVREWQAGYNKQLAKLANPIAFMSATIHDNTLAFAKIKLRIPGIEGTQPLDLDPDVLFRESIKLGQVITEENLIKKKRTSRKNAKSKFKIIMVAGENKTETSYHFPDARHLIQVDNELIEIDN